MEKYITITEAAQSWSISTRRLRTLCEQGRIEGVVRFGRSWAIPSESQKPDDLRIKTGKYIKEKSE